MKTSLGHAYTKILFIYLFQQFNDASQNLKTLLFLKILFIQITFSTTFLLLGPVHLGRCRIKELIHYSDLELETVNMIKKSNNVYL